MEITAGPPDGLPGSAGLAPAAANPLGCWEGLQRVAANDACADGALGGAAAAGGAGTGDTVAWLSSRGVPC